MRIGGLASGLDIDAMVKQLMTAEKAPLNKLNQQKQLTEWKREGYRQVSTNIVNFNNKLTNTYSLSTAIDSKTANVTGANILTAKATGAASNSVLNIQVNSLATASSVVSSGGTMGAKPSSTKIADINSGATSININNVDIAISESETIDSLITKINSNKNMGVTAVYDPATGSMSLTSKETGQKDIKLSGGLLTDSFGLQEANVKEGTNALVTINGITTTQTSNKFTVNGVEISLNGTTPTGQSTQIEIVQDTDKIVETIKSFVDSYNETLSLLNQKVGEERYRTYLPLTSEQKEAMSEDEIKLWEEKAKSGMLKSDSILTKAVSDMRTAIISDVVMADGTKVNLTQFGITTGSYSEKGKLYIDEEKLRAAITENPDQIGALFGQTASNSATGSTATDGIFTKLKKINGTTLQSLSDRAGTSRYSSDLTTAFLPQSEMGNQLSEIEKRITDMNRRLSMIENRYYRQFTAMETAMNKYNSTSSSLASMLS